MAEVGAALARVEAFADGVGRRTRFWGWLAVLSAPAIWAIFLRKWIFDSWEVFAAWLPLMIVLMIPGLVLLGFGKRVERMADLPQKVTSEVGAMVTGAREGITAELQGVKTTGLSGLRSLVGSLKDLRGLGGDVKGIVSGVAGTLRLLNPFYLLVVLGAAAAAGFLAILLVVAVLLIAVV